MRRLLPLLLALAAAGAAAQDRCGTPARSLLPPTGTAPPGPTPGIAFEDSVHALVVFVRFSDDEGSAHEWPVAGPAGRERLPAWGAGLIHADPAAVGPGLAADDPSLSAYFYRHSVGGPAGPHILTGEVWPRDAQGEAHVFTPAGPSTAYRGQGSGYGYLTKELLDGLAAAPGFDASRFDANRDGELDHLMLIVRRDPAVTVTGGVASLAGVGAAPWGRTYGRPGRALTYDGSTGPITVDLDTFGSGSINWVGGEYSFRTLAHEYGHVLFDMGHTAMIRPPDAPGRSVVSNDVPLDVPEGKGAYACQYARMCGGGARNGRPYESSNYDQSVGLAGHELRRMGWANRIVLDPSRDTAGVRVRPLVGSGDVVLVPLGAGAAGDTLAFEYRRRSDPWSAFPPWDLRANPTYGLVARDLPAEGLLATLSHGDPAGPARRALFDVLPPSNRFRYVSRCDGTSDGCFAPYGPWDGDMLHPDRSATQMTPWTRPNVSGYTHYPDGVAPSWVGIQNLRFEGDALAFDVVADVRRQPEVVISVDSWMGAETSGWTFTQPVRVVGGATLTVWQGAEVTFAGGLLVEDGAAVVCHPGTSCGRPALACPVPQ